MSGMIWLSLLNCLLHCVDDKRLVGSPRVMNRTVTSGCFLSSLLTSQVKETSDDPSSSKEMPWGRISCILL